MHRFTIQRKCLHVQFDGVCCRKPKETENVEFTETGGKHGIVTLLTLAKQKKVIKKIRVSNLTKKKDTRNWKVLYLILLYYSPTTTVLNISLFYFELFSLFPFSLISKSFQFTFFPTSVFFLLVVLFFTLKPFCFL